MRGGRSVDAAAAELHRRQVHRGVGAVGGLHADCPGGLVEPPLEHSHCQVGVGWQSRLGPPPAPVLPGMYWILPGMRATLIHGPRDIRVEDVPDPVLHKPTDAVVRVVASCVCGSDLHPYRGTVGDTSKPHRIGHEFVGIVEEVGGEVRTVRRGQFVIAPFVVSDGTCANCINGITTSCLHGAAWGREDLDRLMVDGGQGQSVRVPWADGTLVATPEMPDDAVVPSLLTLSDVMGTGHHAAVSAGVGEGKTVVVVGDGAVGLSAVLASHRLGAERVVAMSRHTPRQAVASDCGATEIVAERGEEGVVAIRELF